MDALSRGRGLLGRDHTPGEALEATAVREALRRMSRPMAPAGARDRGLRELLSQMNRSSQRHR
jgi:hypothetical protein